MSIHAASFPYPLANASLILVCAHRWEALPFLSLLGLRLKSGILPFPLYSSDSDGIFLIISGSGKLRAGICLSAALSLAGCRGNEGLDAPSLVVANFGTAGANPNTWSIGQTLLINRVSDSIKGTYLPERLLSWTGEEAVCHTVDQPQKTPGSTPLLYDMEGFAIAECTTTFLSTSHLVMAKCVLDIIGVDRADWSTLASRCEADYKRGAEIFLEHALSHQKAIATFPRRVIAVAITQAVAQLMQTASLNMSLTTAQQRSLAQFLRGKLAGCRDTQALELLAKDWQNRLPKVSGKVAIKAKLLEIMGA